MKVEGCPRTGADCSYHGVYQIKVRFTRVSFEVPKVGKESNDAGKASRQRAIDRSQGSNFAVVFVVVKEGRTTVEAVPAEPQNKGSEHL